MARRAELTRELIVDAALAIADKEGLQNLTMRRLATELGVTQMAAYHHVADKRKLLELLADDVYSRIELPPPSFGTWDERWLHQAEQSLALISSIPGLGEALVTMRLTQRGTELMHQVVEMLVQAGWSMRGARQAYATVHTYIFGRVAIKDRILQRNESSGEARRDRYFPELGAPLRSDDFEAFALRAILLGLRTQLKAEQASLRQSAAESDKAATAKAAPRRPRTKRA